MDRKAIVDNYYRGSEALARKSAIDRRIEDGQFGGLRRPRLSLISKTSTTINLSATNPDNLSVVELYQNGELISEGSVFEWELTQLTPETPYSFTVRAGDGQGNWSPMSSVLSVTTEASGGVEPEPLPGYI